MSEDEKSAWRAVAAVIDPLNVTTKADQLAFEVLVSTWALRARLLASLREAGSDIYTTETERGGVMYRQRPELAAIADCDRRLAGLFGKFGLTPADRAKVITQDSPNDAADPYDEFTSAG